MFIVMKSVIVVVLLIVINVLVWFPGHSPGPELEFAQNRECYSLAAGLALGMIALGVNITSIIYWLL